MNAAANTKAFTLKEAFGIDAPISVPGYQDASHPNIPSKIDSYVFRRDNLRDLIAFIQKPRGDAMYLVGPTGSGKTSLVEQVAARVNWPCQSITASKGLTFLDMVGMFVLKSEQPGIAPAMAWQDGPLTTAMREGHLLVINEVDLLDPAELSGLNEILAGKPLIIVQNGGEMVSPHPMFRVVVTANTNGGGDDMGLYQGALMQNIAAMDRYRLSEVDYATPEVELEILKENVPEIEESLMGPMIRVANEVRRIFKGNDPSVSLSVTFSTRTLLRWAGLSVDFRGAANPLAYALDRALLYRAREEEREAITQICQDVFGADAWGGA